VPPARDLGYDKSMTRDEQKRAVAEAALAYLSPGMTVGVGTGSTAALFIEQLAARPGLVAAAVPSSEATAAALRAAGIRVVGLDEVPAPAIYVDGADAVDPQLRLIKGAGGALVREKIVASASQLFVCVVDETKLTDRLDGPTGDHPEGAPVPLAVVPLAAPLVSARVRALGGSVAARAGYVTDDGLAILDVAGLSLDDPERLEAALDVIPGVVESGIFARRRADFVLAGSAEGVRTIAASD
jgi:ribose 5-phosphate isomerase A